MRQKQDPPSAELSKLEKYKELNTKQVAEYIGVTSINTVWTYVKEGKIPKPRYLKPHQPLWRFGELIDHTHNLMRDYDEAPRGFIGDEKIQNAKMVGQPIGTAEKLRERLFGRKKV